MNVFNVLLIVHIILGSVSLLVGLLVLLSKKGDNSHKLLGKTYFISMLSAAIISLPMSILHSNIFLFIIGIFTSYMLLTGKRYLKIKMSNNVRKIDWILSLVMLLFCLILLVIGSLTILKGNTFGIVLLVFGLFSALFVYQDYCNFKGKSKIKNYWLVTHLQRMLGSYIATVTAFLVVNNSYLPSIFAWLLPSLLLVPLIIIWSRKFQVKIS